MFLTFASFEMDYAVYDWLEAQSQFLSMQFREIKSLIAFHQKMLIIKKLMHIFDDKITLDVLFFMKGM